MAECRFHFDFKGSSVALTDRIRAKVSEAGGTFSGTENQGTFWLSTPVGEFVGDYSVEKQTIWILVTKKPVFVPCSAIESRLASYVQSMR